MNNFADELLKDKEIDMMAESIKKYTALTSIGTYLVLSPKMAQAQSPAPPGWNISPIK
jgi:hypothetical protein